VTRKIAEKNNLDGVKPGDQIDITYSQAVSSRPNPARSSQVDVMSEPPVD
jgi:hypothetical protein